MGRNSSNVEFLRMFKDLVASDMRPGAFAEACGKAPGNMANYLRGRPVPQRRLLQSCLQHFFEWNVKEIMEIQPIPERPWELSTDPGIYIIYDSGAQVLYVGKATNLRAEVQQTLNRQIPVGLRLGNMLNSTAYPLIRDLAKYLSLYKVSSPRLRHNLEAMLLRVFVNQTHNTNVGNFI